ncbi:MAG: renalase [Subtercola sp.]|nr:renalase [Subtercola sp.]
MNPTAPSPSVLVIGSGISGLACARALHDGGATVRVIDRGRVVGGRLATKRLDDRPVDIGARYFTVPDGSGFSAVVDDWLDRGLARPWTDTFVSLTADQPGERKTGPLRYAASAGLRSLATDLAEKLRADGVAVEQEHEITEVPDSGMVEGIRYDTVVLAMPDPQAARMLEPGSPATADLFGAERWQPTLSVVLAWPERLWPVDFHGAFVNGSPVVAFIADDGDRRGDGAPVLVAHTAPEFARAHLEHPETAEAAVVDEVSSLLGITERPSSSHVHRWTYSNPAEQHADQFLLRGHIAVCGDAWGAHSSVSTAWASGDALGRALTA